MFSCFVPNFFERKEHDCKNIIYVWDAKEKEATAEVLWKILVSKSSL